VVEVGEPLLGTSVAAVEDEAVGLNQARQANELLRVPPVRRALAGAARAKDALVGAVQLVALGWRLRALLLRWRFIVDQYGVIDS